MEEFVDQNGTEGLTVLFTYCADGTRAPMMVFYPEGVVAHFPPEWGIGCIDNGSEDSVEIVAGGTGSSSLAGERMGYFHANIGDQELNRSKNLNFTNDNANFSVAKHKSNSSVATSDIWIKEYELEEAEKGEAEHKAAEKLRQKEEAKKEAKRKAAERKMLQERKKKLAGDRRKIEHKIEELSSRKMKKEKIDSRPYFLCDVSFLIMFHCTRRLYSRNSSC
ncbi:hypothetical protein QAD02_020883 [Eretmocerus hayati]|uniref:Uncharacterized protein n=1 Tax=Eretmocerus hayati TaxID=131215 RepID=A0ACC2PNA6_9HYME|nr:hypothetical protein QAD02_020883 [Eretmocerus hayati]